MTLLPHTLESIRIKTKKPFLNNFTLKLTALIFGLSLPLSLAGAVHADSYSNQIDGLKNKNSSITVLKQNLVTQQESLAGRIASLQDSISDLQAQINTQQAKSDELKANIIKNQEEIVKEKATLGVNLKQMYMESDMTTFEALVSSKNLSDYTNKEQYRLSVENKVKQTMDQIKILKAQQEKEKQQVETILTEQKDRQSQLQQQQAEANQLLSMNQQQQASYDASIFANDSQITQLRAAQAATNASAFFGGFRTGGSGGYPWAGVAFPNSMADPWGMYKRQCVSYAAWKVASTGRHMPYWGGHGNANQWDNNARAEGIGVDSSPHVGDVAVSNAGSYGHVMYVEGVNGNGTIYVSQYNAGWDGNYSEGTRSSAGLVFIHF